MDIDKIKDFFIFHVEKMIVAVVVAASAFLVYQGLNQPNILDTVKPEGLQSDATQVRADLDEDHNEAIIPEREPTFSIVERTDEILTPVKPELYALEHTWDVVTSSGMSRRGDPLLFKPKAVQAKGVITTLAMRSGADEYAIKELEQADPVEKVEKVRKPSRRELRRQSAMSDGDEEEDYSEEEEFDMFDPSMFDPSMAEVAGPIRKLAAEHDKGFRPTTTKHFKNDGTQYPVPRLGWFIAGTAVVPHKLIFESFEHSLKDADEYDFANRDQPLYRGFQLQRADVTDKKVDELVEEDWVKRDGFTDVTYDAIVYWSGVAAELVPDDYRDVTLTMWIPPVLLDDYSTFALHPMIPMMTQAEIAAAEGGIEVDATEKIDETDFIFGADQAVAAATTRPGMTLDSLLAYGMAEDEPAEYKMVRFYDFATDPRGDNDAPKLGRKYVYRVRVAVDDPNFPSDFKLQPARKTLHPEVFSRIKPLLAEARTKKVRQYMRWTEWSDPSEPAMLPSPEQHFVGKVTAKSSRPVDVSGRSVNYERDPPTAKMVISQFSPEVQNASSDDG